MELSMTSILGKDASAEQTIKLFGENLKELGLELEFTEKLNPAENLYSVVLQDKNNPSIRSNGKGMSLLAAQASAIGELAERFLNQAYFEDYYLGEDISTRNIARYKNESWVSYPNCLKSGEIVNTPKLLALSKFYLADDQRYNICYVAGEEFESEKDRKAWYKAEFCNNSLLSPKEANDFFEMPEDLFLPLQLFGNGLKQKLMLPTILPFTDRVTSNVDRGICAVPLINEHAKFNIDIAEINDTQETDDDSLYTFISEQENRFKDNLQPEDLKQIEDLEKQNMVLLPVRYLEGCYCSNGMCAGNSEYEAKVQGLSEICERFVRKFLYSKIMPEEIPNLPLKFKNRIGCYKDLLCGSNRALPIIPDDFISINFQKCASTIQEIKKHGYEITCYDGSLGGIFPVTAVLLSKTENDNKLYKLSIGAHPDMQISLERTLTEMFQGVMWNTIDLQKFDENYAPKEEDCIDHSEDEDYEEIPNYTAFNFVGNFIDGSGTPFKSFFENQSEIDFVDWSFKNHSTKEQYMFLLQKLANFGKTVYCYDVSYKDIYAYRLIAPNFSEIYRLNYEEYESELMNMKEVKSLIECSKFNKKEFKQFAESLDLTNGNPSNDFHVRCGLIQEENNEDHYFGWGTNEIKLLASFNSKTAQKEAMYYINEYFSEDLKGESTEVTYFKCITEILEYMQKHNIKDPNNVNLMISKFNKEIIENSKKYIKLGAPFSFLPSPGKNLENIHTQSKLTEIYINMIKLNTN